MYFILDRYIGKILLYNIVTVLFVLISLSAVIKFVDELRKIGQGCYFFLEVAIYVFLSVVKDIELFLPIAIFLGGLLGLGLFSLRNELIVMEIFGFSRFRIVYSLVKSVLPVVLFGVCINEWFAPVSERIARSYRYKMISNVSSVYSGYSDLWMKDGDDFIYIEQLTRYKELFGVHIYHFGQSKRLEIFRYARYAKFISNSWYLFDVNRLCFSNSMYISEEKLFDDIWLTSLKPGDLLAIVMSIYHSTSLSVFDLYRCICFFKKNGQSVNEYQLRFWRKILFPMTVMVMMLMALSHVLKFFRYRLNIGIQIVIGVVYSFFFIL